MVFAFNWELNPQLTTKQFDLVKVERSMWLSTNNSNIIYFITFNCPLTICNTYRWCCTIRYLNMKQLWLWMQLNYATGMRYLNSCIRLDKYLWFIGLGNMIGWVGLKFHIIRLWLCIHLTSWWYLISRIRYCIIFWP